MSAPAVEVLPDPGAVATTVAALLLERLTVAQAGGGVPQIALTGGTIADLMHRELARLSPASGVDWSRVVVWWGDERFVAADSADRNAGQARAAFLDAVGVDPEHVHEMPSTDSAPDVQSAAASSAAELREAGSGEFEVVMLGVGPDGHVASLFPGSPQLEVDDLIAVAVTGSPKPPPERVSLTLPALNRARAVWFLATGPEKAAAVAAALAEESLAQAEESLAQAEESLARAEESLPAARVRGRVTTTWFLDRAAAADIQPEGFSPRPILAVRRPVSRRGQGSAPGT